MAGRRKRREIASEFWCIRCGKKGIPVLRERNRLKEKGHRKRLYCLTCKQEINHVETRSVEEAQKFREDFEAGKYKEEAEQSLKYTIAHKRAI